MKRVLSVILAFTFLMSMIPTHVFLSSAALSTDYTYTVSGGTATITKYNGVGGDITIPDYLDAYKVTAIGASAFSGCTGISSLKISNEILTIGTSAFLGCTGITNITFGAKLKSIGTTVFKGCTGLLALSIPTNILSLGDNAFQGCTGLKSISTGNGLNTIGINTFLGCTGIATINIGSEVSGIYTNSFAGCTGITQVNVDENNLTISSQDCVIFNRAKTILYIYLFNTIADYVIPDSVTSIGENAFSGCTQLSGVTIPTTVVDIGKNAFNGCTRLVNVVIPEKVTTIKEKTFYNCTGLKSVSMPISVISIGLNAFAGCTVLNNVVIGSGVKSIEDSAFSGCSGMTMLTISDSVISIGINAFLNCISLTNVVIPDKVTSIGASAFSGCKGISTLTCGSALTSIGANAFTGCTSLANLTVPNNVSIIGKAAFKGCTSLAAVSVGNGVTDLPSEVFGGCTSLTIVNIGSGVSNIDFTAFTGCALAQINISQDNMTYSSQDCVIFNKTKTVLIQYLFGRIASYIIPGTVNVIGTDAFKNCKQLNGITIPGTVLEIGKNAFYGCTGLSAVSIPRSVTSMGEYAFYQCTELTAVSIPDSLNAISNYCFGGCSKLISVNIPSTIATVGNFAFSGCVKLISVTIQDGVSILGASSFAGCTGLTTVSVPNSVLIMGSSVFSGCTALTSISLSNNITNIADSSFYHCSALTGIVITNNVTNIGVSAFNGCTKLTDLSISTSATNIDASAFSGCVKLASLKIPNSVTILGDSAFLGCTGLYVIKIGSEVTTINANAFKGCTGLTTVFIPAKVSNILANAFQNCSALKAAYFFGDAPMMGANVFQGCAASFKVYYIGTAIGFSSIWYGYTALIFVPLMTPTLSATPTTVTNSNVTLTISYPADVSVKEYKIGEGAWTVYTTPLILTVNCTVYARCADASGNLSDTDYIIVKNIDKTPPVTPTFAASPSTPTTGNVTLTITYPADSDLKEYKIDGSNWTAYSVPISILVNCVVSARCADALGNMSTTGLVTVSNIDKTAPATPMFSATPATTTNGNVSVTIIYPADAATKEYRIGTAGTWTAYTASVVIIANDILYARCADAAGNTSAIGSIIISNIDRTAPSMPTLSATPTAPTNGNVTVTINHPADAAIKEYRIGSAGIWNAYTGAVVTLVNCTIYTRCTDAAGNISAIGSIIISNIDKTAPSVPSLSAMPTAPTNGIVTVTITYSADAVIKEYKIGGGSWTAYTAAVILTTNDTVSARCSDIVGNISTIGTIVVSNIDKIVPAEPTFAVSPTAPTNGNVTVTINYPADASVKEYKVDGEIWTAYTVPVVLTVNCSIYARCADAVGNTSGISSKSVSNIDKIPPSAPTISASSTNPTADGVTVIITYPSDASIKEYKIGEDVWNAYTSPILLTKNNTVYSRCADAAGNSSGISSIVVGNIFNSVKITSEGSILGDVLNIKVPWYKSYNNVSLQLGFVTNDSGYTKVEWLSGNSEVLVSKDGKVTNIKTGARSAKITIKLTDSNGAVLTDTIKVVFYKFKYQLNSL